MSEIDRDDAAFRARLAPLSQAVLPGGGEKVPAAGPPNSLRPASRHRGMALAGIAAVAVLLMAGWAYVQWRPFSMHSGANAPSAAPPPPAVPAPPDDMVGILLQRGDAALAAGDITAARLLYEHAAARGSAVAATKVGKTYDIAFLLEVGARGIQAEQDIAATWYRKAAALGDPEARERLRRMAGRKQP